MNDESEVQRLERVYRAYHESPATRAQWEDTNPGNRATLRDRQLGIERLLHTHGFLPLAGRRALEVGCGSGQTLATLLGLGAQPEDLIGVDLLPDRIAQARQGYPNLQFQCTNAEQLDFPDAHFHLALLFTVLSSILDEQMARNVTREAYRVVCPGGAVLWYDFRYDNPRNPNVRGMTSRRIRHLFPDLELHLRSITPVPPLVRHLGPFTKLLYPFLATIPPLRTHYLGLLLKPK